MSTIYWNPQYTGPMPTKADTIEFTWGIGSFDKLTAANVYLQGGSIVHVNTLDCSGEVNLSNGSQLVAQNTPTVIDTLTIGGGENVTFVGGVVVKHLIVDNGSTVHFNGGLTVVDTFEFGGGSQIHTSGYMDICGTVVEDVGDVSSLWDSELKSGSSIYHDSTTPDKCYLKGTLIETPHGFIPVEDLKVGDEIVAYDDPRFPTEKKITYVMHDTVTPDFTGCPDESRMPVVIVADAFGPNKPVRDLRLTPEHMIVIGGNLVPVRILAHMDGRVVHYDKSCEPYTFYHFKTETHSIVNAEGILSESLYTGDEVNGTALPVHVDMEAISAFQEQLESNRPDIEKVTRGIPPLMEVTCALSSSIDGTTVFHPVRVAKDGSQYVFAISPSMSAQLLADGKPEELISVRVSMENIKRKNDLDPKNTDDRSFQRPKLKFATISNTGRISCVLSDSNLCVWLQARRSGMAFLQIRRDTKFLSINVEG